MKYILKKLANLAGYDVSRKGNNHNSIDFHLASVFSKYEVDCVIDVGANVGQYGEFLRGIGYRGWIVSFEPVISVFNKLAEKAKNDDKWVCYHLALGDTAEEKSINVYSSSVFSSFLDASEYSKNIWKSLENVTPEVVKVTRLDNIFMEIANLTGAKNYYLKLDTQGYDLNVFRGARNSLDKVRAMQTELSLIHVYEGMPDPYETLSEFHLKDFLISGCYPINRDESLAVIEYDCVLVKRLTKVNGKA